MKDSMNAVFGHALEQINQEPALASRIKGKVGAALASVAGVTGALAMAGLLASGSAQAQGYIGQSGGLNTGCVVGSVAGGLLGNQVGGGNGKTVATALGAVAGCVTGSAVQNNNEQARQRGAERHQAPRARQQRAYESYPSQSYPAPVAGAHPMSSYAPACMAQWNGERQPSRPLSREASVALGKGEAMLSESYIQARDAQEDYAGAYANFQRVKQGEYNPYNNMNSGDTAAIREASARANADLNRISRQRQDAERVYAGNTLRVLDACEYAASQGEDVRSFAKLQGMMTLPMANQWTLRHPTTGANVRIVTGGQSARLSQTQGYDDYEQPRSYRP